MLKKGHLLFLFFIFLPLVSASVKITEVMYNPDSCSNFYCEWIEIYNDGEESVDLADWLLCEKNLLAGYIDREGNINLETTIILPSKSYAIVTDGGTGTEVYSNFAVNSNSVALHVDASSLCGGLNNSKETIILKDNAEIITDSMSYNGSIANGDGNSMQLCSDSWSANITTPGAENCPSEETEEIPEEQGDNEEVPHSDSEEENTEEIIDINDNTLDSEDEPAENTGGLNVGESGKNNTSNNFSYEENTEEITGESVSNLIYESKSEKLKNNSIYLFAFVLILAIFYTLLKKSS